jgi:4-amino-4-deoxy-L-arabinose transferase-like glycosyltransferase
MFTRHFVRITVLMLGSAVMLGWIVKHRAPDRNVGLRSIHQAEQIDRGLWRAGLVGGADHPLHPLLIVAAHRFVGGDSPGSWQRAALFLCFAAVVLLVIPVYLLALELIGEKSAWLACLLVVVNPVVASSVVNVLPESTFLFWWASGLYVTVRFLREGRFLRLPPAIILGALAYLTRPEGLLLPLGLAATLLLMPLRRVTRINWPRWWRAMVLVAGGLVLLVGPYIALEGSVGTNPGVARVLGLAEPADPVALERETPLPAGQSTLETYRIATMHMLAAFTGAVTPPLVPAALFGLALAWKLQTKARAWFFLAIILIASAIALVRLHAVGGYCAAVHAMGPAVALIVASSLGIAWLMDRVSIPGRWLGLAHERLRPGPAVWSVLIAVVSIVPIYRASGPLAVGPFSVYYQAGEWLDQNTRNDEKVLDLTDWSLYLSERAGYQFADLRTAPAVQSTRWIVARRQDVEGHWHYCGVIRDLIGGREPVVNVPPDAEPNQIQIQIYDLAAPLVRTATTELGGMDCRDSRPTVR